jgi:hypothetical protein
MRYLLFGGHVYYAGGGGRDFIAGSDIKGDLVDRGQSQVLADEIEWWSIFDAEALETVARSTVRPH